MRDKARDAVSTDTDELMEHENLPAMSDSESIEATKDTDAVSAPPVSEGFTADVSGTKDNRQYSDSTKATSATLTYKEVSLLFR